MSGASDTDARGSWASEAYVAEWTAGDAFGDVLTFPRRLSAAIAADAGVPVGRVADLGSGAGAYLDVLLRAFPSAQGTWIDASPAMLPRARERLSPLGDRVRFVLADVRNVRGLPAEAADVIISSRVIHHFHATTIRQLYDAAFERLRPGGFLFNLDHFRAPPGWEERYRRVRAVLIARRGAESVHEHDAPPQPLGDHLTWLREAGFEPPDVPWRLFFTALLAARKPA